MSGSNVYVGGAFDIAGGLPANCIAKWNGTNWSALGGGIRFDDIRYPDVHALAVSGFDLYVGGFFIFNTADGTPASSISKWNGTSRSALGSGVGGLDPAVRTIAVSGTNLYAGGYFTIAGGKVSAYVARAHLVPSALSLENITLIEGNSGTTNATFTIQLAEPHVEFVSVDYATADGTATAGSDYVATSGTVVFNPGQTTNTIVVPVNGDLLDENNETFFLRLSNPTNITLVITQVMATVLDDDRALSITQQPQSQTTRIGSNVLFGVAVTSVVPPLTYQWQFNGADMPGATDSILTLTNVQFTNGGDYGVVLRDAFGSVTSQVARLTLLVAPVITEQPQPVTVVVGENATFTVTVTNNATLPINYQWRKGTVGLTNILLNTTNCSFTLYNVQTNGTTTNGPGNYRVVVSNTASIGLGTASSLVALTVIAATPPEAVTLAATNIAANGATVAGSINPNGATTLAHFDYGLTTSYGNSTPALNVGNGTIALAVNRVVAGLVPGTAYHFRLAASNSGGTNYGADLTFTTTPAVTRPTLVSPVRKGNQFSVSVTTVSGAVYHLDRKPSLGDSNWTPVANLPGDGLVRVLTDPAAIGAQSFYRVRVE